MTGEPTIQMWTLCYKSFKRERAEESKARRNRTSTEMESHHIGRSHANLLYMGTAQQRTTIPPKGRGRQNQRKIKPKNIFASRPHQSLNQQSGSRQITSAHRDRERSRTKKDLVQSLKEQNFTPKPEYSS